MYDSTDGNIRSGEQKMKPIRFSGHAQAQLSRRGVLEEEVEIAIQTADWQPVRGNRFECRHDFAFGEEWNGKFYETKQVRPIFVDETNEIAVITVYSYYF
jgi:hypothetical protein